MHLEGRNEKLLMNALLEKTWFSLLTLFDFKSAGNSHEECFNADSHGGSFTPADGKQNTLGILC